MEVTKENGRFDIRPLIEHLYNVPDGIYEIVIKKKKRTRSIDQNSYLWGVVYPIIQRAMIDAGYEEVTSTDMVHDICKSMFCRSSIVNKESGEIIVFPVSTKVMDTLTFHTYVNAIRDWANEYLNTYIPEPV